jgi:hypothetical protein
MSHWWETSILQFYGNIGRKPLPSLAERGQGSGWLVRFSSRGSLGAGGSWRDGEVFRVPAPQSGAPALG